MITPGGVNLVAGRLDNDRRARGSASCACPPARSCSFSSSRQSCYPNTPGNTVLSQVIVVWSARRACQPHWVDLSGYQRRRGRKSACRPGRPPHHRCPTMWSRSHFPVCCPKAECFSALGGVRVLFETEVLMVGRWSKARDGGADVPYVREVIRPCGSSAAVGSPQPDGDTIWPVW